MRMLGVRKRVKLQIWHTCSSEITVLLDLWLLITVNCVNSSYFVGLNNVVIVG